MWRAEGAAWLFQYVHENLVIALGVNSCSSTKGSNAKLRNGEGRRLGDGWKDLLLLLHLHLLHLLAHGGQGDVLAAHLRQGG